tara:strand:+ start:601 stop:3063 length:2463 start_codon:yes stop_codon:yes gene_type:complete
MSQNLNVGWKLHLNNKEDWIDARVPGNVHLDHLENRKIPDPFFGQNEAELQWISDEDWTYKLMFEPDKDLMERKNIILFFHGLDTYADIFLNNIKVLSANNMFHPWSANVKDVLRDGMNNLEIHFRSPLKEVSGQMNSIDHALPADNDQAGKTSPYTRKAPYHYGWDWGPCLVTSGIWKEVELIGWEDWYVDQLQIKNKNVSKDTAELEVELTVLSDISEGISVCVRESLSGKDFKKIFRMEPGANDLSFTISIDNPDLWWPVGHGDQILHEFFLTIETKEREEHHERRLGIRDVKIRRDKDEKGESFEIHVNGIPIYSKGANWIPADYFVERLTRDDYKRLLNDAIRANMNTLRIWGGGIYESDHFYELCDEMGIMVWQDFMFACSMYPGNDEFLDSVEKEARYQVNRLKGYASVILWCGNNEIASGWLSWGWKEELPISVWQDYKKLFHELLPKVCNELDPERFYWPSSPGHGIDQSDEDQIYGKGDNHYWGVWHGGDEFDAFEDNVGRFMTEYGMQSFPATSTIESFADKKDRVLDSAIMNAHQKASLGTGNLMKYIEDQYRVTNDFDSVTGLSQIMQAESIRFAVEAHRRHMPYCMGTLYWQFNDCWPVISWSSIDYKGNWKALHYSARNFFKPVILSLRDLEDVVNVHVVNDRHYGLDAVVKIGLFGFNGDLLFEDSFSMEVKQFSSCIARSIDKTVLLDGRDLSTLVLRAELTSNRESLSKSHQFFKKPKELKIPPPEFEHEVKYLNGKYEITIRSSSFLYQLHFISSQVRGVFSDNYFNMLPNEVIVIEFEPYEDEQLEELGLKIRTLYEMMN